MQADDAPLSEEDRAWAADPDSREALAAIARRLERDTVRPGANLELDLGLDSMERVELLTLLERRAGTRVAPDVRATIFTVRQLVDAVRAAAPVSGGATGQADAEAPAELAWDTLLGTPADPVLVAALGRSKLITAAVLFAGVRIFGLFARVLLRYRTSGVEHLPAEGPFIISPNHQSYLDGFFLAAALPFRTVRHLFFVGAAEYFESRFMRWVASTLNIVPVDPDANLVRAMQAGAAGLRLKKVLILFPEGERSIDGELKKFRKGAAILSAHLDAPIVPVAMDGVYDLWPRGRSFSWRGLLPWRATPVTLRFGPPVRASRGDYTAGTDALRRSVADMFDDIRRPR